MGIEVDGKRVRVVLLSRYIARGGGGFLGMTLLITAFGRLHSIVCFLIMSPNDEFEIGSSKTKAKSNFITGPPLYYI